MTKVRLVFVIALSVFSSQAFGQDAMKKGDKQWTDLEKVLWDADQQ